MSLSIGSATYPPGSYDTAYPVTVTPNAANDTYGAEVAIITTGANGSLLMLVYVELAPGNQSVACIVRLRFGTTTIIELPISAVTGGSSTFAVFTIPVPIRIDSPNASIVASVKAQGAHVNTSARVSAVVVDL